MEQVGSGTLRKEVKTEGMGDMGKIQEFLIPEAVAAALVVCGKRGILSVLYISNFPYFEKKRGDSKRF